jgi:hypothetical protein
MTGTFAAWQPRYAEHGVPTFPVDLTSDAKKPAVRGYLKIGLDYSGQLALRFPANDAFGFAPGARAGITVLDIDSKDERERDAAFDRHGEPAIVVRTLRGHWQGWYRHNGEGRRVRPWPNRPIDVLGGGFVCAPPSLGPQSRYAFVQGTLRDLDRLTTLRNLDLPAAPEPIHQGTRDNTLFRRLLREVRACDDFDTLLDVARTLNMDCVPRLNDAQVISKAKQAWKYETEGRNLVGSAGAVIIPQDLTKRIAPDADAFALYALLMAHHGRGAEFVLSRAMAGAIGWRLQRFRAARDRLANTHGVLECIHAGGRGPHDPPIYRWCRAV